MEYMEERMDDEIERGLQLESAMSELLEKVENTLGINHIDWGTIDPRRLMWTIIQYTI